MLRNRIFVNLKSISHKVSIDYKGENSSLIQEKPWYKSTLNKVSRLTCSTWVAQPVKYLTLGFGSGCDLRVPRLSPTSGLHTEQGVCLRSFSLLLCSYPSGVHPLHINKWNLRKKHWHFWYQDTLRSCSSWYNALRWTQHPFCDLLVKKAYFNLIMQKYQANPSSRTLYKINCQFCSNGAKSWGQRPSRGHRLEQKMIKTHDS